MRYKLSNGKFHFNQWDTGAYLLAVEPPDEAEYFLEWYGATDGTANMLEVSDSRILIPDEVFKKSGTITVICRAIEDGEYMYYKDTYIVEPISKPSDYIETETQFAEYIARVKTYIDTTTDETITEYFAEHKDEFKGDEGTAATIEVGNVTSGTEPSVNNSGTSFAAKFDFVLPKGDKGDPGEDGTDGKDGSDAEVTEANIKSALGYTPADSSEVSEGLAELSSLGLTVVNGVLCATYNEEV